MSFTERLEFLMRRNGISNNSELARLSGIPYTTIDGFYKKGTDNIKLSTLRKLCKCLHCSLDYLTEDSEVIEPQTLAAHFEGEDFTEEEMEEINNFVKFVGDKGRTIDFIGFFQKFVTYMYTSIQFYLNQKSPRGSLPEGSLIKCRYRLR